MISPFDTRQYVVGIQRAFDVLSNQPKYPPHDIIRVDDSQYQIVLAVAGFKKSDIEVTLDDSKLKITGARIRAVGDDDTDQIDYIYNGISHRSFTKTFGLSDTIEVVGAKVEDGILTIDLKEIVPDTKKTRKIELL